MSEIIVINKGYSNGSDILNYSLSQSDNQLIAASVQLAASASGSISATVNHTKITSVFLVADGACTATFDGSSNPALTMVAGVPYQWDTGCQLTSPFPANFTTISLVNSSSTAVCNINCRILYHA